MQLLRPERAHAIPYGEQGGKAEIAVRARGLVARRITVRELRPIPRMPAKGVRALRARLCDGGLGHRGGRGGASSCRWRRYRPRRRLWEAWHRRDARSQLRSRLRHSPRLLLGSRRARGAVVILRSRLPHAHRGQTQFPWRLLRQIRARDWVWHPLPESARPIAPELPRLFS